MLLFHYCSNASMHSIISTRTVRLQALALSNDSREGRLVSDVLLEVAKEDGMSSSDREQLKSQLGIIESIMEGLGFCLSEDGDLLSQWRGYADDARGVSIGFDAQELEKMAGTLRASEQETFKLQKVEYDRIKQKELVRPTYEKIKEHVAAGAFKFPGRLTLLDSRTDEEVEAESKAIQKAVGMLTATLLSLLTQIFFLKSYAFREEREWRMLSLTTSDFDASCSYRPTSDCMVPFRQFQIPAPTSFVKSVVLGPRNRTPVHVMKSFLKHHGFAEVEVTKSEASYR